MLHRLLLLACLLAMVAPASEPPAPVTLVATIAGDSVRLELDAVITAKAGTPVLLLAAAAALDSVDAEAGHRVAYDDQHQAYTITFARDGDHTVHARFALRGRSGCVAGLDAGWLGVTASLPPAIRRSLRVVGDRVDLDLVLPGALRVARETVAGVPVMTATLGPDEPLTVAWKQRPANLVGDLVVSCDSDVVVRAVPGALRVDALFAYDIAQGSLERIELSLAPGLEVTAVDGSDVLDWRVASAPGRGSLVIRLGQPQRRSCYVRVQGECAFGALPQLVTVPTILPEGTLRAGGTLAIGTDSALQLVVDGTSGLTQVDAADTPRLALPAIGERALPARSFLYVFPAAAWTAKVALADIAPVVDVEHRLVATVREDELVIEDGLELDIREAPLRTLEIQLPAGFTMAAISGAAVAVDECTVRTEVGGERVAVIALTKPVSGRTVIDLRLELGHGPLDADVALAAPRVRGARSERGVLALAAAAGLEVEGRAAAGLRPTPPAALPLKIADARAAWRLAEPGWSLVVHAVRRPAAVRAESFQLAVLGEGALHGSLAVAYVITGAPIDELRFSVPVGLRDVEVVGADVAQTTRNGTTWTVRLRRKVVGDYNLALAWTQPLPVGASAVLGEVRAEAVDAQSGYLVCASQRNVAVTPGLVPAALRELAREEIPAGYRLLVTAPILRAWRHLGAPPRVELAVAAWPAAKLLPAVVEVAALATTLAVREDGAAESLTRARYHVKNATSQSLALRLPSGARVWSVERIAASGERERLTATDDGDTLRIPLERLANPNQPATVEVTYGETHRGSRVVLVAPACIEVRTTYAGWTVSAPDGWAVRADGGVGMVAEPSPEATTGLAGVMARVGRAWEVALRVALGGWPIAIGVTVVVAALALIWIRAAPTIALIAVAALLSLAGARAGLALHDRPWGGDANAARTVAYAEVLDPEGVAPAVTVRVLPRWRSELALGGLIAHALLAVVAVAAAWRWRRTRPILGALAVAGVVGAMASLPAGALLVAHLFAWGVPLTLLGILVLRLRRMPRPPPALLTALALAFLLGGCGEVARLDGHRAARAEAVELRLSVEPDALALAMTIRVRADGPLALNLLPSTAVLTTPVAKGSTWRVERRGGGHVLLIDRAGDHRIALGFVLPLAVADDHGQRSLALDPPAALTVRAELSVPATALEIVSDDAIGLAVSEAAGATLASARFAPGGPVAFSWHARGRHTADEVAQVYADVAGALRFDAGLVEGRHRLHLRIPQGELRALTLRLPPGMVATGFSGPQLATWRFDPATATVEARFAAPVSGEWSGVLATRTAAADATSVAIGLPKVVGAEQQRGVVGLYATPVVALTPAEGGTVLADADFQREAGSLLGDTALSGATLRSARRLEAEAAPLVVGLAAVTPELRVRERATLSVSDERLVYADQLAIEVAKAGVFSVELLLPTGWDVDALSAPELAHWDELAGEPRRALLHLTARTQGSIALTLGLSRTLDGLPPRLVVPRVALVGSLRHAGEVIVAPELGVRLTAASRTGVSELDPAELGVTAAGALAFRLLQPGWEIALAVERVAPVVTVAGVHQARVGEGLVRHAHRLHVRAQQAGLRVIEVAIPAEATAIVVEGPDLAQWSEALRDGGRVVRVELRRKWVEKPYPLALAYETRFDADPGAVAIVGARVLGAERQRDHLVVHVLERVELVDPRPDAELTEADARAIPRESGLGELADAAFCYAATGGTYRLGLTAKRHLAATQLEARVDSTTIDTVVAASGSRIDRVRVQVTVGAKRHLVATLPPRSQVWALTVDRRPVAPASDSDGRLLLPLPQASGGETTALVELVYAVAAPEGRREFSGPRFDLPLTGVRWTLWLPEGWAVTSAGGTLEADAQTSSAAIERYDLDSYARAMAAADAADRLQVRELQAKGVDLARNGNQYEARRAFDNALNYSTVDAALNEDARVQLNRLGRQQAVVGLIGRRSQLRRDAGAAPANSSDLGDRYNADDAERLAAGLGKDDNANLERIAARLVELQALAAGAPTQLAITLPVRGRRLVFTRALQVDPAAEMTVRLSARERPAKAATWPWTLALALALLGAVLAARRALRAPAPAPVAVDPWTGVDGKGS